MMVPAQQMKRLDPAGYPAVAKLFADLSPLHGSVRAVLSGAAEGEILADASDRPTLAILRGPEGVYLGGEPAFRADPASVRASLNGWDYIIASPRLAPGLATILPHAFMLSHERVRLAVTPVSASAPTLPAGYVLRPGDDRLTTEIHHGGIVVASCSPDMIVGTYAEIGIRTHPDHRRRGLATSAVLATLDAAAAAGLTSIGWHCLASNRGSLAVARIAGFKETHRYEARAEILPAENAGDLSPTACRAHAERLEPGVASHIWLGFHIAGAWAQAGEADRALAAIERLVASDWLGQPEWLEQHWSLAPLQAEPRFMAAVAEQRVRVSTG